jgi:hypothetical protein
VAAAAAKQRWQLEQQQAVKKQPLQHAAEQLRVWRRVAASAWEDEQVVASASAWAPTLALASATRFRSARRWRVSRQVVTRVQSRSARRSSRRRPTANSTLSLRAALYRACTTRMARI